jgi:hypothetical protein
MFTLSAVITNVCYAAGTVVSHQSYGIPKVIALPVGMLMDKAGPRFATLLGAFFFFCGNVVFGIGIENDRKF